MTEKCSVKFAEEYGMCTEMDVWEKKSVHKWGKLFKEGLYKDRPGWPPIVSSPEMVGSVNALILNDRKFTVGVISEWLEIFVGTTDIVHNVLAISKVSCCCWVAKMLTSEHKQKRVPLSHSVRLVTTATSSVQSRSGLCWFPVVGLHREFLRGTKLF